MVGGLRACNFGRHVSRVDYLAPFPWSHVGWFLAVSGRGAVSRTWRLVGSLVWAVAQLRGAVMK